MIQNDLCCYLYHLKIDHLRQTRLLVLQMGTLQLDVYIGSRHKRQILAERCLLTGYTELIVKVVSPRLILQKKQYH